MSADNNFTNLDLGSNTGLPMMSQTVVGKAYEKRMAEMIDIGARAEERGDAKAALFALVALSFLEVARRAEEREAILRPEVS